jgi:hypothetical protein
LRDRKKIHIPLLNKEKLFFFITEKRLPLGEKKRQISYKVNPMRSHEVILVKAFGKNRNRIGFVGRCAYFLFALPIGNAARKNGFILFYLSWLQGRGDEGVNGLEPRLLICDLYLCYLKTLFK